LVIWASSLWDSSSSPDASVSVLASALLASFMGQLRWIKSARGRGVGGRCPEDEKERGRGMMMMMIMEAVVFLFLPCIERSLQ